jgi:hypothetical protein
MANPQYGSNKQDNFLDALAHAADNIVTAGTGTGSAGEPAKSDAEMVLPITINGVTYYIGLWASNDDA